MDYASDLDDCKPLLEISIIDENELSKVINTMEIYQENEVDIDIIKNYRNAINKKYKPHNNLIKIEHPLMEMTIELSLND